MCVESTKRLQMLGLVFFSCGVAFLAVGLATKLSTFYFMSPAFLTLGIVFFAKSKAPQE